MWTSLLFCDSSERWTNQCSVKHVHHGVSFLSRFKETMHSLQTYNRHIIYVENRIPSAAIFLWRSSDSGIMSVFIQRKSHIVIIISLLPDWSERHNESDRFTLKNNWFDGNELQQLPSSLTAVSASITQQESCNFIVKYSVTWRHCGGSPSRRWRTMDEFMSDEGSGWRTGLYSVSHR